jgi:nucleotide-binding universal stress UspA family protein
MKFLVGYTGSEESKAAMALARDYAKIFDAKVIVVTSMEGGAGEKPEDISRAEANLKSATSFFEDTGVTFETQQLARGFSPGEDLVMFAEENDIDLMFVGIEKKSKTRKMLLGSTAQYVILKSPCPVVTAK